MSSRKMTVYNVMRSARARGPSLSDELGNDPSGNPANVKTASSGKPHKQSRQGQQSRQALLARRHAGRRSAGHGDSSDQGGGELRHIGEIGAAKARRRDNAEH